MKLRERVDRGLDRARLVIDGTVPAYQPQDEVGTGKDAARDASSRTRWNAMEPVVRDVGAHTALDIGCNVGWFVTQLSRMGIPVVGVEGRPATFRSALYARDRAGLDNVGILAMNVTPATVSVLPDADCVLLLSVWHHMVRENGIDEARELLRSIWSHTQKVLFFENGQEDIVKNGGLDQLQPDGTAWLRAELEAVCAGGTVRHLGQHAAINVQRDLFAVTR